MKQSLILCICLSIILFLFIGCMLSDDPASSVETHQQVSINFTVAGVTNYGEGKLPLVQEETRHSLISDISNMSVSVMTEGASAPSRATTRSTLDEDVRYRVLAYKADDNSYAGYADYKIAGNVSQLIGGGLALVAGSYQFVAYSYDSSSPITEDPETGTVNVDVNKKYLYWEGSANVSQSVLLPIYFKNLFMQLQIVFDSTDLESDFTEASVILGSASGNLYKEGVWNIGSTNHTNISSLKTPYSPTFTFSSVNGRTLTSLSQRLLPLSDKALTLTVNAKFANGKSVSGKVLALNPQSFHSNNAYTCTIRFTPIGVTLVPGSTDASGNSYGGGNCWVLPASGLSVKYFFPATMEGRSLDPVGTIVTPSSSIRGAKLVWEEPSGLISSAPNYSDGQISFKVGANKVGNAVIAVTDSIGSSGKILWSWHIWVVNDNSFMKASASPSGTFMNRLLGAMGAATPGSLDSYGLYYQWGRKDPLSVYTVTNNLFVVTPKTLTYAVEHPDIFITSSSDNWSQVHVDDYWAMSGNNMLKFNPCPKGWTLMSRSSYTNFKYNNADDTYNLGLSWNGVFFPAPGYIRVINNVGKYSIEIGLISRTGLYWTFEAYNAPLSYSFQLTNAMASNTIGETQSARENACSVRCVRE